MLLTEVLQFLFCGVVGFFFFFLWISRLAIDILIETDTFAKICLVQIYSISHP